MWNPFAEVDQVLTEAIEDMEIVGGDGDGGLLIGGPLSGMTMNDA